MDATNKILAIDDEEFNREIISEIFANPDYEMQTAESAEQGLELLRSYKPDVVLLDIMLPGMSGYEACEKIRADQSLTNTKVILVSGKAMIEERIKGYEVGADDYVTKPFHHAELEAKVNVFGRLAHLEAKLQKANEALSHKLDINTQKLVHSEKMASLGQLAAGVAHEINNPIGFINSNLGTLKEYVETFITLINLYSEADEQLSDELRQKIQALKDKEDYDFIVSDSLELIPQSIDGAMRVKEIVQGLKSFARVDESSVTEANVNEIIEQSLRLVWNEIKYKCQVNKEFSELPNTPCYSNQLSQVFMNLLINASHAIEENGLITITTRCENETIFIEIEDNGSGIKPENIEKLFDPFFTTKEVGKGTGLGLAISYGILQKHKGSISVESELGKGTTFILTLPLNVDIEEGE